MLATGLDWPELAAAVVSDTEDVETRRSTWFLVSPKCLVSHCDFMDIQYVTASARSVFKKT